MTQNQKLKNPIIYAIIGGTIVLYIIKPLLDILISWSATTSLIFLQKWQNRLYSESTAFTEGDLNLRILYYLILSFCVFGFYFILRIRDRSIEINKKIDQISSEDKNPENSEVINVDLVRMKNRSKYLKIISYLYALIIICYLILDFGKLAKIKSIKAQYNCKINLLEQAGSRDEVLKFKIQWHTINSKENNLKFHNQIDSLFIKYAININEYCN